MDCSAILCTTRNGQKGEAHLSSKHISNQNQGRQTLPFCESVGATCGITTCWAGDDGGVAGTGFEWNDEEQEEEEEVDGGVSNPPESHEQDDEKMRARRPSDNLVGVITLTSAGSLPWFGWEMFCFRSLRCSINRSFVKSGPSKKRTMSWQHAW